MMKKLFKYLFFLAVFWDECEIQSQALLPSIASKMNKVIFIYPTGAQSERDLFICPENSACNIMHKRFWLPPLIERLCRCPQRRECNWTWSDNPDDHTMSLDNRSQIKFCREMSDLPNCTSKKLALRVTTQLPNGKTGTTLFKVPRNSQKPKRQTEPKNVTALCNCQDPHYWKLKMNSTKYNQETDQVQETYFCSKLKKCSRSEFCGYVRTDTYSTFYRCSCPKRHLCISRDKMAIRVEELLFSGYGYKAFCHPI